MLICFGKSTLESAPAVASQTRSLVLAILLITMLCIPAIAQSDFEKRPLSSVGVAFEDGEGDSKATEVFRKMAGEVLGDSYSAVRIRNAIQAIYDTGKVESVSVEAMMEGEFVKISFLIKRKEVVRRVRVAVGRANGKPVTEDEIFFRLDNLTSGSSVTEQTIRANVGSILAYLRERGYFKPEVGFERKTLSNKNEIELTFLVAPGDQARVGETRVEVTGFDSSRLLREIKLKPGTLYSREGLLDDFERVKKVLRERDFLAARLDEPNPILDKDSNTVAIVIKGSIGPQVEVTIEENGRVLDKKKLLKKLPIKQEGTLEYSAIVEGGRKLEEAFQEQGFFFVKISALCSVDPVFRPNEASHTDNDTEPLCSGLGGADLSSRRVKVRYVAKLGRQLTLADIKFKGLEDFLVDEDEICRVGDSADNEGRSLPVEEIRALLGSTKASLIGIVPYLGYGRGYTSARLLTEDEETIRSLLNELGYRSAKVSSLQGVSIDGRNLIITFEVDAGTRTKIVSVEIRGNKTISSDKIKEELGRTLPPIEGRGYSRALVRNAARRISELYAREGFFEARVNYSIEDIAKTGSDDIKVIFSVENEGSPVVINRVVVNGSNRVSRKAVLNAVTLKPGQLLRSSDIFASEQNLYATDVFRRVVIKPEIGGDDGSGRKVTDVSVDLEEQAPRTIIYGGGYSTDAGPFGSFDVRHYNLFGRLQQGGARVRLSRLRQLVQFDFVNPRFLKDGRNQDGTPRFAPLTVTAQFQKDSTVTRFFRSAFDKGTFGIVQRIDENGNPVDEFGGDAGSPTINRLSISAESSRTLSVKNRTILFARYRYEDVRLSNIESLLIKDLLRPDSRVRISGFGVNIVRDTRENCRLRYSLVDIASKGGSVERCKYNPGDATKGSYLTAEYTVSIPALGATAGFHKFQSSYNFYYSPRVLKNTTLAGRAIIGAAHVFSRTGTFSGTGYPELDELLPISERFFAGGSQSIRGFDFESAGPRVVVVPRGVFRDSNGQIVNISPFTVPYGGNALAMVNLEARIPVSESVRLVPFYDGGNVFRTAREIFKRPNPPASDVFRTNLKAEWTNTFGFGIRIKTPVGGDLAVDYGYLLNPPSFLIPQTVGPNTVFTLHRGQIHFRFAQAF